MADADASIHATVHGFLRGRDLDGDATITIERDALALVAGRVRMQLELRSIEGCALLADSVELHLNGGDVVKLDVADPPELVRELERAALRLPEFTRSLRAFGSRRATAGALRSEHDGFFTPLLAARGAAERESSADARLIALDSRALREAVERRLRDFAIARYPSDAPERRALEAELLECAAPLHARFAELDAAQERLASCDPAERFARWRGWAHAVAGVFESADECWPVLGATLTDDRYEEQSRWHRLTHGAARRRLRP
jgi:hypothetical protein